MISLREHWRRQRLKQEDRLREDAERALYGRRQFVRGLACAPLLMLPGRFARSTPGQQLLLADAVPTIPTDPSFSSVALLLHYDGANTGSTFTDSSSHAQTVTRGSSAVTTSTTRSKFGTASGRWSNSSTGSWLTGLNASWFSYGTGDLTIELWAWSKLNGGNLGIFTTAPAANPGAYGLGFRCNGNPGTFLIENNWAVEIAHWASVTQVTLQWNHIALVRSAGAFDLYYNGVAQTKTVTGGNENRNFTQTLALVGQQYSDGTGSSSNEYGNIVTDNEGYMDDLRVTTGVARYTANFTPPSAAFPDS